jgi:hypothetical protein
MAKESLKSQRARIAAIERSDLADVIRRILSLVEELYNENKELKMIIRENKKEDLLLRGAGTVDGTSSRRRVKSLAGYSGKRIDITQGNMKSR